MDFLRFVDSKLQWIHKAQSTPFAGLLEIKAYTNALAFGEPNMASIQWIGTSREELMVDGVTLYLNDIRKVILNHTTNAESILNEKLLVGLDVASLGLNYISLREVPITVSWVIHSLPKRLINWRSTSGLLFGISWMTPS